MRRHSAARPKPSGKTAFFRETTGHRFWDAKRCKRKMPYRRKGVSRSSSPPVGSGNGLLSQPRESDPRGAMLVLLGALCFSTSGTAQAFAPEGATPYVVGALRMQVAAEGDGQRIYVF